MLEALIVTLGVGLLAGAGIVAPLLPAHWIVVAGAAGIAAGLALGVPTGVWYHVELHRALRLRGPLPERWWVRPAALHARLDAASRSRVLPWFYVGGVGFVVTVLGCAIVVLGILLQAHRAGLL